MTDTSMTDRKRAAAPSPILLEDQNRMLMDGIRVAKKRRVAHGSFNSDYWKEVAQGEELEQKRFEVRRDISLRDFTGTRAEWDRTEEGKAITEERMAKKNLAILYRSRAEELDEEKWDEQRGFRPTFYRLFSSSKLGWNVMNTGAGKRNPQDQSNFRRELIESMDARHQTDKDSLWCPILGKWLEEEIIQAAHLFPYAHGQGTMDAMFGTRRPSELFSAKNGILVASRIEKYFDAGKFVIIPATRTRHPTIEAIRAWLRGEPREYKIKIIDKTWDRLNQRIRTEDPTTWADIDGKQLEFRNKFRPAARYIYFHNCAQVIRHAWAGNHDRISHEVLVDEIGKPFWGTPGRYLPDNMLLSVVEEMGHEYKEILGGVGISAVPGKQMVELMGRRIHRRPAIKDVTWSEISEADPEQSWSGDGYDGQAEEDDCTNIE
ncbi:HNH endonuclease signature motif containing protein [Aspergillus mulundensis]|uniref:HNH nuclease domain-containing protein n=1 Tax=Aspergillus mulundensis TaxID=1810919 RepID=A0A3D8S5F4_9EURO|nr:hypothetical protein DSM5745_05094 [Aspergillus mulundensis]RDW81537.1 hypothetical protein DSM5745_05094 [Aspergillus mulundensis]